MIAHRIKVSNEPGRPFRQLPETQFCFLAEPFETLILQSRQNVSLWRDIAPQADALPPYSGQLQSQFITPFISHRLCWCELKRFYRYGGIIDPTLNHASGL
jgi:hypothetical protein